MANHNRYGFLDLISKTILLRQLCQSFNKLENKHLRWFRLQYLHTLSNPNLHNLSLSTRNGFRSKRTCSQVMSKPPPRRASPLTRGEVAYEMNKMKGVCSQNMKDDSSMESGMEDHNKNDSSM
jgi:hypothetical protein